MYPINILIDGTLYQDIIPHDYAEDGMYDGEEITFLSESFDEETGEFIYQKETVGDLGEYIDFRTREYESAGYLTKDEVNNRIRSVEIVFDAIKNADYEILPTDSVDREDMSIYGEPLADHRDLWDFDRDAIAAIKDDIDEYSIYDEELNTKFLVHAAIPPEYDETKAYPVILMTDAVWRFSSLSEMRKLMESGEAEDVILVSLGYDYKIDGTNEMHRYMYFYEERDKLLDFITDNLMPYLGENYNIDYSASTLFGHSKGGVFAHYALFNSDLYENQPFGNYIIGSPVFWGLYDDQTDLNVEGCMNDYGYFDRNETLDKKVFLCAGSLEDPDYAEYFKGHDTTLEGVAKLNERLGSHGADVTYKLYESHHYQYVPEMLNEFLKQTYPKL